MRSSCKMEKPQDGWDNSSNSSEDSLQMINIFKQNQGRNILNEQYSLQPDMITGWMPKLPSCPIPLTYQNKHIQLILTILSRDPMYDVVYRGPRNINSVQLHKKYQYKWKYRERYEVKVNALEDAINNIGLLPDIDEKIEKKQQMKNIEQIIDFDSDFQSGNLDLVVKIKSCQYDCFIRSDSNTKGHTNWYYFKVNNKKNIGQVQFNICNIVKNKNLYGKGMAPYMRITEKGLKSQQWSQKCCYEVQFVQRLCRYGTGKTVNQLQFKYNFQREDTELQIAYSIPYTYSNLLTFIDSIKLHPFVHVSSVCESFSGLDLPLLTIAHENSSKKSNIIISARIHPGQTNSSFLIQGFIKGLLENSSNSLRLISSCNFYIIPMMNPDGVVAGNYRTSFSGRDLNRKFNQSNNFMYPQINGLIRIVKRLRKQRQKIDCFFDFHSHSSKKNLFCYGPQHPQGTSHYFHSRVLAKILSRQDSMFDYQKCIFNISQSKKTTARAYMLKKQNIPMTFTFQISNGIYNLTNQIEQNFDKTSLLKAGRIIYQGLSQYSSFYFKQYDISRKFNHRLSVNLNKITPTLRKHGIGRKSQNQLSSIDISTPNSHELKEILQQIAQEHPQYKLIQQNFSDNESSDHDMEQKQLKNILDIRTSCLEEFTKQFRESTKNNILKKKDTLSKIASLKNLKKKTSSIAKNEKNHYLQKTADFIQQASSTSTNNLSKYKKNKIYYQDTHPPTSKKVMQHQYSLKKAIKQRKFPILF